MATRCVSRKRWNWFPRPGIGWCFLGHGKYHGRKAWPGARAEIDCERGRSLWSDREGLVRATPPPARAARSTLELSPPKTAPRSDLSLTRRSGVGRRKENRDSQAGAPG